MTPGEVRRAMRARKKALRQAQAEARRRTREQLAQSPAIRRARARRRLRQLLMLGGVVLLIVFLRCDCEDPPPAAAAPLASDAGVEEAIRIGKDAGPPETAKPAPVRARVERQPRARFQNEPPAPPSWLEAFRLQVAARSPRLARCFTGVDRPGALKWTSSVNTKSGAVSDHEIEPLGPSADVTQTQRECVLEVLSHPAYRLPAPAEGEPAIPNRISLVIEF